MFRRILIIEIFLLTILWQQIESGENFINITEKIETALFKKVEFLRRNEFWEYRRGRLKNKPIPYQKFQFFQLVIQTPEILIERSNDVFHSCLIRMKAFKSDKGLKEVFIQKLIETYDVSESLEKANSIYEIYEIFKASEATMFLLPIREKIFNNVYKWLQKIILQTGRYDMKEYYENKVKSILLQEAKIGSIYELNSKISSEISSLSKILYDASNENKAE